MAYVIRVRSHWRVSPRGKMFHVGEYFRRVSARGRKMLQSEESRKHLKKALAAYAAAGGTMLFHHHAGKKHNIYMKELKEAFRRRYGGNEVLRYGLSPPTGSMSSIWPLGELEGGEYNVKGYRIVTPVGGSGKSGYLNKVSAIAAHEYGHVPEMRRLYPVGRMSRGRMFATNLGVQALYFGLPAWALSRLVRDPRKKDIAFAAGYAPVIAMEAAASARGYKMLKDVKGKVTPEEALALVLSPVSYGAFAYGARQLQKAVSAARKEELGE